MANRAKDWLNQAKRDLEHAENDLKNEFCEWACFSSVKVSYLKGSDVLSQLRQVAQT